MKYITEDHGSPCNIIESTPEEFFMFKEFLKKYGVEARRIYSCGNTCKWQIRNGYKDWVHLYRNGKEESKCERIIHIVEENIKNNSYSI